jgi:hypothetical protein
MVNCKQSNVDSVLSNGIPADETELSIAQNAFEFMVPYGYMMGLEEFVEQVASYNSSTDAFVKGLGLNALKGKIRPIKDSKILD